MQKEIRLNDRIFLHKNIFNFETPYHSHSKNIIFGTHGFENSRKSL